MAVAATEAANCPRGRKGGGGPVCEITLCSGGGGGRVHKFPLCSISGRRRNAEKAPFLLLFFHRYQLPPNKLHLPHPFPPPPHSPIFPPNLLPSALAGWSGFSHMEGKTKKEFRLAIPDAEIRPPQVREKKPSVQQSARTDGDEFEWLNRSFLPRALFASE